MWPVNNKAIRSIEDAMFIMKEQKPDIAIVDHRLPSGEDAVALLHAIKAVSPNTRVILYSSLETADVAEELRRSILAEVYAARFETMYSKGQYGSLLVSIKGWKRPEEANPTSQ